MSYVQKKSRQTTICRDSYSICTGVYFLELGVLREVLGLLCDELEERALELDEDVFGVFTEVDDSLAEELRELDCDELLLLAELRVLGVERLVLLCAGLALLLLLLLL